MVLLVCLEAAMLIVTNEIGADIELEKCDPGDIDPHAVASLYKSFLRERECHPRIKQYKYAYSLMP